VGTRLFGRIVARRYGGKLMTALPGLTSFLARLAKDQRGGHTAQVALAIVLFALVAAFGFFFMGDAIADFFVALSRPFNNAWN
jgi:small neutral amino acid transporter SnatA (MarC family)